jgi:hypothetical protein
VLGEVVTNEIRPSAGNRTGLEVGVPAPLVGDGTDDGTD